MPTWVKARLEALRTAEILPMLKHRPFHSQSIGLEDSLFKTD